MLDKVWDFFVDTLIVLFMPLVCSYYAWSSSVFFNVSAQDATGIEWVANGLFSPLQYLLAGKEAKKTDDGSYIFVQRFDYSHGFWIKTASSIAALPASLVFGTAAKGASLATHAGRERFHILANALHAKPVASNLDRYREMGLHVGETLGALQAQGYARRPGDEQVLSIEKEALREIGAMLTRAQIPWWVDAGTCLGAYRYGGVIPWDSDIDVAILLPDFVNVHSLLHQLDPAKYLVQDWSTRDHPNSYMKVYVRKSNTLIDIYCFDIHPETKELQYILSMETNMFMPEWWRIRERRFTAPVAFDAVFPLKQALLDGVAVFVPNNTEKYLQRYYGKNLSPVKIYDPITQSYEKDLSHPYWQRAYVK
jgi:hypothetical protein